MKKNHLHICLHAPEIPQNTGNIGRLVAATQCRLHIVEPTGFGLTDKNLRRPGLDYWPFLDLEIHKNLAALVKNTGEKPVFLSKKSKAKPYTQIPKDRNLLVFGNETSGLPQHIWEEYPDDFYYIPMFHEGVRSLNLANAVSVVLYHHLWRRLGWDQDTRID